MQRDEEQNTARIIGIILFCSGFIIICMTGSKAMDGHDNFYYALGTLFSILGLYLFFAHNFRDLNLEIAFYLSFMSFLLTFALFFTKAYDDITTEKNHSFIPGVNDEGIAMIGMSVFYTLFFVFLLVFIYKKNDTKNYERTDQEGARELDLIGYTKTTTDDDLQDARELDFLSHTRRF